MNDRVDVSPLHVVIVGASLAGLHTARSLRDNGFSGNISFIGDEPHFPYERPPLIQVGPPATAAEIAGHHTLPSETELADFHWNLGVQATGLLHGDRRHTVQMSDGTMLDAQVAILATGARPRMLQRYAIGGVHVIRTAEDAAAVRGGLATAEHVVVIGCGFLGGEIASTARLLNCVVTVVDSSVTPAARHMGTDIAQVLIELHRQHGIDVRTSLAVEAIDGDHTVRSVRLSDGTTLKADMVVLAVGVSPNTEWAAGSAVATDNGFVADAHCLTAVNGVYAVGDCANVFDPTIGTHVRTEHRETAIDHARRAAAHIMRHPAPPRSAPYFRTLLHGKQLQASGHIAPGLPLNLVEGSVENMQFVATYGSPLRPSAVVALDMADAFTLHRDRMNLRYAGFDGPDGAHSHPLR